MLATEVQVRVVSQVTDGSSRNCFCICSSCTTVPAQVIQKLDNRLLGSQHSRKSSCSSRAGSAAIRQQMALVKTVKTANACIQHSRGNSPTFRAGTCSAATRQQIAPVEIVIIKGNACLQQLNS
jgi:hypothetical protein